MTREQTPRAVVFGLYDDVLPCRETLRAAGVRMALLSNELGHGVEEIAAHVALDEHMAAPVRSGRSSHRAVDE